MAAVRCIAVEVYESGKKKYGRVYSRLPTQ